MNTITNVTRALGAPALALAAGAMTVCAQLQPAAGPAPVSALPASPGGTPVSKPTSGGPRMQFAGTRFDFGKIKASEPVVHEFVFTNTGNAVLEITAVQPGCTKALPWDRQVQPGQIGRIPIQFNPAGFTGPQNKSVTITCNDPVQSTHSLSFQVNIWQPIEVQPAYVYFMPVEDEETNETKVVRIVSNLDEPLTLTLPLSDNPALQFELKAVQPGKEFALHITHARPPTNTIAMPQTALSIDTSSTNVPQVKVTVGIMPQPAMTVSPLQIQLPQASGGTNFPGHRHSQLIRNNSSTLMKITEASVNADGVTVQVTESQPGKWFTLTVAFPAGFTLDPKAAPTLTVKTTHPKRPIITVPIVPFNASGYLGRPTPPGRPAVVK